MKNFIYFLLCLLIFFISWPSFSQDKSYRQKILKPKSKPEFLNKKKPALKVLHKEKAPVPFKVEILAENLGIPWGMAFLNKEELIWTEREGNIKKIHIPTGKIFPITGGPEVYARGQGGLLDLVLHPQFKTNKTFYLSYSIEKRKQQSKALAKGILKRNKITHLKTLFIAQPFYSSQRHFGSRLIFDDKGFLFMSLGDRTKKSSAQNLNSHWGKLLRLNDQGKAPEDNPFAKVKGARAEIWSLGHRNPQGLFIHPETKKIFLQEHGPRGGDEINLIKRGANYGWPVITHGRAYSGFKIGEGTHKTGMEQALKYWTPSIAPCGLLIYSGKKFPQWRGHFFSGALALRHLNKLEIYNGQVKNEERLLSDFNFRFRHVIEGPEGFIYASVDQGKILKISPL